MSAMRYAVETYDEVADQWHREGRKYPTAEAARRAAHFITGGQRSRSRIVDLDAP